MQRLCNRGHLEYYQISPEMINSANTKMCAPIAPLSLSLSVSNYKKTTTTAATTALTTTTECTYSPAKPYLCYKNATGTTTTTTMLLMMMNLPWFRHKNKQKTQRQAERQREGDTKLKRNKNSKRNASRMLEKRKENEKHSKEIAKKLDKAKLSQARQAEKNFACSAARTITKIMKSDNYSNKNNNKYNKNEQPQTAARVWARGGPQGGWQIFFSSCLNNKQRLRPQCQKANELNC